MWFRPGPHHVSPAATCEKSDRARIGTWDKLGNFCTGVQVLFTFTRIYEKLIQFGKCYQGTIELHLEIAN